VTNAVQIDRGFLRTEDGLMHYRIASRGKLATRPPLVMAHGGPGCSAGLAPLMADLGAERTVAAADMMGNGESDPPPPGPTTIGFYAEGLLKVMDHLGLGKADLYGHHTGAQVICELAIAHPERVGRLVLDGAALFTEDQRAEFLDLYAPRIVPDAEGRHLDWVWTFLSQTTQYFPHYLRDEKHSIVGGAASPPEVLTLRAAEVLKVWSTYHLAYRAAFEHDLAARLPLIGAPTLVLCVDRDPLACYAEAAARLMPRATVSQTARDQRAKTIRAFLSSSWGDEKFSAHAHIEPL